MACDLLVLTSIQCNLSSFFSFAHGSELNRFFSLLSEMGTEKPKRKATQVKKKRVVLEEGEEVLFIYKLLDVDEETLFYWVKDVTGLMPRYIHLSDEEDKAVVKVPLVEKGLGEYTIPERMQVAILLANWSWQNHVNSVRPCL